MKNFFLLLCFLVSVSCLSAQEKEKVYKHEIKINALNLILGNPEIDYEYLIDANSGFGLYANFNVDKNRIWEFNYMTGLYYRLYVGNRYASGFFFEGGLSAYGLDEYIYNYPDPSREETKNYFGPNVAIGGKFVINKSIAFEFFGGIGRSIFVSEDDYPSAFPRIGVSIGKRF